MNRAFRLAVSLRALALASCLFSGQRAAMAQNDEMNPLRIYARGDKVPIDPNGFLFNPQWRGSGQLIAPSIKGRCDFRAATGHLDRRKLTTTVLGCLSDDERAVVTLSEAPQPLKFGAECVTGSKTGNVRGHVNWFPITATGQLRWRGFGGGLQDHDVTVDLVAPMPNASTSANKVYDQYAGGRGYHMEFYDEETLELLPESDDVSFWHTLRAYLDDKKFVETLINDRIAVATGLFGVDGVHGFHAELHPVYALAILVDRQNAGDAVREEWAVMLRNAGTEGDCSEGVLPMFTGEPTSLSQDFFLDLGTWPSAGKPALFVKNAWSNSGTTGPDLFFAPDAAGSRHAFVRFAQRRPRPGIEADTYFATIELVWPHGAGQNWEDRFNSWRPPRSDSQVGINLKPLPTSREIERALRRRKHDPQVASGAPGNSLVEQQRPKILALSAQTSAATQVFDDLPLPTQPRVELTPSWSLPGPVLEACDVSTNDPMCHSAVRWTTAINWSRTKHPEFMAAVYVAPHSTFDDRDGVIHDVFNYLLTLGYRFDFRRDRLIPTIRNGNTTIRQADQLGNSLRVSSFVSPNTIRLWPEFWFSPYTIANIGLSMPDGSSRWRRLQPIGGWGFGIQPVIKGSDFFVEIQHDGRNGGYASRWVWATGMYLRFPGH